MKLIAFTLLILSCLFMSACNGIPNPFGGTIEIVNNRAPNGTFLPANQVPNAAGEIPDSFASLYHYPSGNLGVSAYAGALNGRFPALSKK